MTTQFLELPGGRIAFDDQGQGPLVLCIPAGGDLRSEYRFLTPRLVAAGYRVVTMDLRGQGESTAYWPSYTAVDLGSDMLALIKYLAAAPAFIIGTSVAAGGAIWAAAEAPEWVAGLALIGAYARPAGRLWAQIVPGLLLNPLWGRALYAAYFPKLYPTQRPTDYETHLSQVKAMLREPGRLRALRRLFSNSGEEWDARVAQVEVPVLIMMGSRDPDFKQPEQEARLLAERLQAAAVTVQIIEDAGHHPQVEMPEPTAAAILAFLTANEPEMSLPLERR